MSKSWFKYESTATGVYYTPTSRPVKKYKALKDGAAPVTPAEMAEFLNENQEWDYVMDGKLFVNWEYEQPSKDPIELPDGAYMFRRANPDNPERLCPMELREEQYIELSGITSKISEHLDDFMKNEELYKRCGLYKLGILLYGPPGNGKSSLLRNVIKKKFAKDAVIIFLEALPSFEFIKKLQTSLPDKLKVFVLEELVTTVERMNMDQVLNFLDGEQSIDHSIVFATTNYPEKLPGNLVDRPSRFDALYEVPSPDAEDRRRLLSHFLNREASEEEVKVSKGLSAAAIKEAVVYASLKKLDFTESVKRLKAQSALAQKAFAKTTTIGLARDEDDIHGW